ncbi:MAG: beta-galactosidase, partial [Alistipes sp.]|nr:beta-galactosidase [Alistipes sp.]
MKRFFALLLLCVAFTTASAQWKPAGDNLKTEWGENLDPNNVLPEYPRPIMEREKWQNLNGLWNYAIRPKDEAKPAEMDGDILVPFAVESSLSGVMKPLGQHSALWYEREFTVPSAWKGNRILLHFGAVDWHAQVWINDMKIGEHKGGYSPFSFDITPALQKGANKLTVKVLDPGADGWQPRGKQSNR